MPFICFKESIKTKEHFYRDIYDILWNLELRITPNEGPLNSIISGIIFAFVLVQIDLLMYLVILILNLIK